MVRNAARTDSGSSFQSSETLGTKDPGKSPGQLVRSNAPKISVKGAQIID